MAGKKPFPPAKFAAFETHRALYAHLPAASSVGLVQMIRLTRTDPALIAFAELGFEMFGHGQSGLLLGGEAA